MSPPTRSRGGVPKGHARGSSTGSRSSLTESYLLSRPPISLPLSSSPSRHVSGDDGDRFTSIRFSRERGNPAGGAEEDDDAYYRELETSMRRNSTRAQGTAILKALSVLALIFIILGLLSMTPAADWTKVAGLSGWDDLGGLDADSGGGDKIAGSSPNAGILPPVTPSDPVPGPSIALEAPTLVSVESPAPALAENAVSIIRPTGEAEEAEEADVDLANNPPAALRPPSPVESVDISFCGTSPCRIVLSSVIGEGESKAQMHLGGVLASTVLLNATFITPNTNHGHFGSCRQHPFEFYFDVDQIAKRWQVRTRSFEEFEEWILRRNALGSKPSIQMVSLFENRAATKNTLDVQKTARRPSRKTCLRGELDWTKHFSVTFLPKWGWWYNWKDAEKFANFLIRGLSDVEELEKYWIPVRDAANTGGDDGGDDDDDDFVDVTTEMEFPEIIAYDWHLKYAAFPEPGKAHVDRTSPIRLPYAAQWQEQGRNISSRISPFISVHWRMETVDPENLMSCSHELHAKIKDIVDKYPDIKHVFFLTDFPLEGDSHPHSLSFTTVTNQAREAVADFVGNFSQRTGGFINLTTLIKELPFVKGFGGKKDIPIESLDMGLVGMIDKVMAEDAEIFLTGVPHRCARFSSFTKQVVAERREKEGEDGRTNVVDYWPATEEPWY